MQVVEIKLWMEMIWYAVKREPWKPVKIIQLFSAAFKQIDQDVLESDAICNQLASCPSVLLMGNLLIYLLFIKDQPKYLLISWKLHFKDLNFHVVQ